MLKAQKKPSHQKLQKKASQVKEEAPTVTNIVVTPRIASFSKAEVPLAEALEFYNLNNVAIPKERPYAWSNSVASLDGVASFKEEGAEAAEELGGKTDFRLLNTGWTLADAVLITPETLKNEPDAGCYPRYDDLVEYRLEKLEKTHFPYQCILTNSGNVDPYHPIFSKTCVRCVILTSEEGKVNVEKIFAEAMEGQPEDADLRRPKIFVFRPAENGEGLDLNHVFQTLRCILKVKYLDVSTGGSVISQLLRLKLLDEVRMTTSGQICGPFNSAGQLRPKIFPANKKDDVFTVGTTPLIRNKGLRVMDDLFVFTRGTVTYRH